MQTVEPGVVGQKAVASGRVVATSQHPVVTDAMLDTVAHGGNAVDAVVTGALIQATIQQEMTNHAGTVSCLYWDNLNKELHDLNSVGTPAYDLAPFHRVPGGHGFYAPPGTRGPFAVLPGFIPGLAALHGRFGSRPWETLVTPAVPWAEEGNVVTSFEHFVQALTVDFFLYTPSGRQHFLVDGHLPQVGDRWPKPALAQTLRGLAAEGPEWFTTGPWARAFVQRANDLGWDITIEHLTRTPPRWGSGQRFTWRDHEIVQLSAPERQAAFSAITLGVFDALGGTGFGHYSQDPEGAWALGHALRIADRMCGYLNDTQVFESPVDALLDPDFHESLAKIVKGQKTSADLSNHVTLTHGPTAVAAAGGAPDQPAGSCELTVVDAQGNWVQLMNTLQSGGIPGEVVGGVPMVGSHSLPSLAAGMSHWLAEGARIKCILACTMVLRDGEPWWSLGSPGNVHCTAPQVLLNGLGYSMSPNEAEDAPRMLPMDDNYVLGIESRVSEDMAAGLARRGVLLEALAPYDFHMGTYQMAWRDGDEFRSYTGRRRAGKAAGAG
ncbi:gamma-glutamyltransferase [Nakamurella lactea]|uniref:gamma-glutamyltransferase n=1 Tax=Nakamurella lactea TaxID=459515 RepID=UPI0004251F6A|nr:gamma-glutamyltransferase [Nakamurella lactea]